MGLMQIPAVNPFAAEFQCWRIGDAVSGFVYNMGFKCFGTCRLFDRFQLVAESLYSGTIFFNCVTALVSLAASIADVILTRALPITDSGT